MKMGEWQNAFPADLTWEQMVARMKSDQARRLAGTGQGRAVCALCGHPGALMILLPDGNLACVGISFRECARQRRGDQVRVGMPSGWLPGHWSPN